MTTASSSKRMTAAEAVRRFVSEGATVGIGGQTIGRNTMALAHEIVRQGKRDLTLVGCSMGMSMDVMVGAGLVKKTACGTGNLERFGTAFRWRSAIEAGEVEVEDYSHLSMALRFLAGSLGLPFIPTKSLLGTDILAKDGTDGGKVFEVVDNPWNKGEPVVLLPALSPDVSIVHAQKADETGNVIIEGFTAHEREMAKASKAVIVSCEEVVSPDVVRSDPARTSIPYLYIDAVVEQPWGAYPTSTFRYYEHDGDYMLDYQTHARAGGDRYREYLQRSVYDCATFDDYLQKSVGDSRLKELHDSMQRVL